MQPDLNPWLLSESTGEPSQRKVEGEVKASRGAIVELTVKASALAKNVDKMLKPPYIVVQHQATPSLPIFQTRKTVKNIDSAVTTETPEER